MWKLGTVLGLLAVLFLGEPALARIATIEASAPLQDSSEQSIKMALAQAIETVVKGAAAMGFSWVQISRALLSEDGVTVQIVATDTEPEGEETGQEEGEPTTGGLRFPWTPPRAPSI